MYGRDRRDKNDVYIFSLSGERQGGSYMFLVISHLEAY